MSQKVDILNHMVEHGSITQGEATASYGCTRLAARIDDLKRDGHSIRTEMIDGLNRFGKPVRFARYTLDKEDE